MKPLLLFYFSLISSINCLSQLPTFSLTTTVTNASCPNNGEISFSTSGTVSGATIIFQVYELPSNILLSSNSSATSINSLTPGNYKIVATQNLGLQSSSQSSNVTVNSTYTPLTYGTSTTQNVICGNDGVINISITNGMPSYSYELFSGSISGTIVSPLQSSPTFTNLTNGTYIIRTFDMCGNAFPSLPVTVGINPPNIYGLYHSIGYNSTNCDSVPVNLYYTGNTNAFPITSTLSYTDGSGLHTIIGNSNGTFPMITVAIDDFPLVVNSTLTDACGNIEPFNSTIPINLGSDNSHKTKALCEQFYYSFIPSSFFSNSGYTINFTSSPTGFNPISYNSNHPGEFLGATSYGSSTNPLPEGNYSAVLTNDCGISYSLNFSTFKEVDSSLQSSISYSNCGDISLSIYRNDLYFDSVFIVSAPSSYNQTLPFNISSSLYSNHSGVSNFLEPGFYKFMLIDSCGITRFFEITLTPPSLNIAFQQLPGCQIGYGSCLFQMNWVGQGSISPSGITSCYVVNAPPNYPNTLPFNLTNLINTGSAYFHTGELVPGDYTFSFTNSCGDSILYSFTITAFSIITTNFEYEVKCNYINLRFNTTLNNNSGVYLLQINNNGVWSNVTTINGSNSWQNYLTLGEGDYRIVYNNSAYAVNNFNGFYNRFEYCITSWNIPFTIDYPDPEIEAINSWNCGLDNYNAYVTANGAGPITYKIIKFNGTNVLINNGTNPLFTGLSEGLYLFQISDVCGNIRTRYMEIRYINNYIFPDSICDGENGSLSIFGFSALNNVLGFKWWKGSDPSTILSTTTSIQFTPFNNSIHQGEYFVEIYSISNPALCPDTASYYLNTAIIPTAGLDSSSQICNDNTIIDLSPYLSSNATIGGYWVDTVNNLTFYGNQLDLSSTPNDTITVFYIVTGACDFKDTAVFTFNVIKLDSVQVINCPDDTLIFGCPQIVDWNTPVFFTSCSTLEALSNFNENDFFQLDTTVVTYTCNGPLGDVKTCSFNVIILDTVKPLLNCSSDTILISDAINCGATYNWPVPQFSDNCDTIPTLTLASTPAGFQSGSTYPIGLTSIFYTVVDASGNTNQCQFSIEVIDTTSPFSVICPSDTSLTNTSGLCSTTFTWIPPTFDDNCDDSLTIWFISSPTPGLTNGGNFPVGITKITYFASDNFGNLDSCSFTINVLDNEDPIILNCNLDTTINNLLGFCSGSLTWPTPIFSDNCDNNPTVVLTSTPINGLQNSDTLPIGTTHFVYLVTDLYGNSSTCSFYITVDDNEAPTFLNCQTDTTINNNIDLCSAIFSWDTPLINDNCDALPQLTYVTAPTVGLISGDSFPLGQTTITYTAVDTSGNISTCSFSVFVVDSQNPIIQNCPNDTILINEPGICGAHVNWVAPTFSDNCDQNLSSTLTSSPTPGLVNGSEFPVGLTTMNYLIVDSSGNQSNCTFKITVNDAEFPQIINIPAQTLNFCDGDNVVWPAIISTDNCTVQTFVYQTNPTQNLLEGTPFPVGNTSVIYTAVDQAGNTTVDSFIVHVEPILVAKVNGNHKACKDDPTSLPITFTCINGQAPYQFIYSINGGPNQSIVATSTNSVTLYHPTSTVDTFTYSLINVIESSGNYCPPTLIDSSIVIIYPLPLATITGDTIVCQHSEPGEIKFTGSNATPKYTFNYAYNGVSNLQVQTLPNSSSAVVLTETSQVGEFYYTLNLVTESANNCKQTVSQSVLVKVKPSPIASFYCEPAFIKETENVVHLINESQGETAFTWDFDDGTSTTSLYSPFHQFSVDSVDGYWVQLSVINEFNCIDTAIRKIEIKPDALIYVPNSFTPDGSTVNDFFIPKMSNGVDENNYSFLIFNRWGELVFESYDVNIGWNGTYQDGQMAQDGVYIWIVKYKLFDSTKIEEISGHVNLIR
jgi:gliding motility-associated-like protein